jgi:hypothetical protein
MTGSRSADDLAYEDGSSTKRAKPKNHNRFRQIWPFGGVREPARRQWRRRCCDLGRIGDKSHKAMDKSSREAKGFE